MPPPLLSVRNLTVRRKRDDDGRDIAAVNGLSFDLHTGDALGVVGESGSGKTQTFLAAMGLLGADATIGGQVLYDGRDVLTMPPRELDNFRGNDAAMIFQDPMTALNPSMRLITQLTEGPRRRHQWSYAHAKKRAAEMLELVGVADAARRLAAYPHELSGGLRQRATIAMALLVEPKLLIADEPTTALDATVQMQILSLLAKLRERFSLTMVFITHDLAAVAAVCDKMMVMYAGRAVETGPVADVFAAPHHPYTAGLLAATPRLETAKPGAPLPVIPGNPPDAANIGDGCAFAPRCPFVMRPCASERPELLPRNKNRFAACHCQSGVSVDAFHLQNKP